MTLVTNGRLITRDSESRGYYEHGAVAYEGTKITEVGEETMLRAKYPQAEFIDAKGGVIMPAFINAHTHIYSALARGLSIAGNNPNNFYEVLDGTWWAIDRHLTLEGTRASANALYMDCIKQGVTTIFDHHASYGEIPGSLHTIAESAKRFGVRSCLCYEVSDRDGEEKCRQAIQENADFIAECEKEQNPMLAAMFGGHALFTLSDKTFDRMVEANNGRTGYHIHVSEGMNDVYDSLQNYGRAGLQHTERRLKIPGADFGVVFEQHIRDLAPAHVGKTGIMPLGAEGDFQGLQHIICIGVRSHSQQDSVPVKLEYRRNANSISHSTCGGSAPPRAFWPPLKYARFPLPHPRPQAPGPASGPFRWRW